MKRVTAIILATIILFTSFIPVVATENSTVHTENKKVQWLVENNFLVGRGKSRDLKLGSSITRAEFTRMALVAKGEEDAAKEYPNVSTKFKDVNENHWAVKLISYASEKGYISGYPDGNFKPEGDITYEEIISILARIHPNYTKIETKSNGWAEGFIKFATENGILEGLKIESSYKSPAIREKTFEMIYNFINIENNYAKETKSTKPIETKNENYFGWNGFYPYWFQFGYRPRAEKPVEPEVKPEPGTPDVKPEPEEPKEPETPETPKEFDKENIAKIEIKTQPNLNYTEGEQLDLTGLEVTLTDNQGLTKDVTFEKLEDFNITASPANETTLTSDHNGKPVVISKDEVKAETNALTVKEKVFAPNNITKIEVKTQPTKLIYTEGESLDLTGLKVTLTDNQGLTEEIGLDKFGEYGITTSPENGTELKLTNNGNPVIIFKDEVKAETDKLTVNPKVFDKEKITGIEVLTPPTKLEYTEGEKLDLTGLVVTLTDNQGLTKNVDFKDFIEYEITVSIADKTSLTVNDHNGAKITVTKGNFEAQTDALTVKTKVFDKENIAKIEIKNQPNLTYTEGDKLDLMGLVVTLTDNQELTKDVEFKNFKEYGLMTDPTSETQLTADRNGTKIKITKGNLETETNALTVNEKVFDPENVETIEVKDQPTKLEYTEGEILNLAGLVITLIDNQNLTKDIKFENFEEFGITTDPTNGTPLTITDHNGKTVVISKDEVTVETEALTVNPKVFDKGNITKIEVKAQPNLTYTDGEQLDLTGLEVTLTDNQGLTKDVKFENFNDFIITISPENGTTLTADHNETKIKITKGNLETETNTLTVKAFDKDNITKIEVITQPKLEYFEREFLDLTGLKVRLTDNKGATKEVEFKDFNEYGIKTRPSNDRQLLMDSYKEVEIYKGTIKTTTAPLIIKKRVFDINLLDSIGISKQPKTNYTKGEKLNLAGMEILLVDKNGATEKFGITGIIAKGYKLEITPSDGTVLGVEHNKQPVIVKVNNKQTKTKPIHVYLKIDFMKTKNDVHSTKVIQLYTSVKKPDDPTREGYKFMGWYTDLTFETPFDFDKALNDNMEVYAKWEAI